MNIVDKILFDPITRGLKFFTKGGALVNTVEYASGAITADANTTTTVYGPAGSPLPTSVLTATRVADITWQSPIRPSDTIIMEVASTSSAAWYPVNICEAGTLGYLLQNGTEYGAYLNHISSLVTRVAFAKYARSTGANYGTAGSNWTDLSGFRWRVRKTSI